jgi:hypothetical protein
MRTMAATLAQLQASADRLAALIDETEAERERRNELIVDLVDQGVSRRDICQAGRVSPKSVCLFLAMAG